MTALDIGQPEKLHHSKLIDWNNQGITLKSLLFDLLSDLTGRDTTHYSKAHQIYYFLMFLNQLWLNTIGCSILFSKQSEATTFIRVNDVIFCFFYPFSLFLVYSMSADHCMILIEFL